MDNREATALLTAKLARWRGRTYGELRARIDDAPTTTELRSASGAVSSIQVQVFWDAAPGAALRVLGAIDDGGLRAFVPLTDGFLLAPDGTFVGEDPG